MGPYWYYDENGNIAQWYYTIWYMSGSGLKVPFCVDYVDINIGIQQDHIDRMKVLRFEGYGFYDWKDSKTGKSYDMQVGNILTSDIKLVGDRGDLCGDNLRWKVSRGVLTIEKIDPGKPEGALWDFEKPTSAPWSRRASGISEVKIENGVTYIGTFAFCDIADRNNPYSIFTFIEIPTSVTAIAPTAFSNCLHLLYIYYLGTPEQLYGNAETGEAPLISGINELVNVGNAKVYANVGGLDYSKYTSGCYWDNIQGDGHKLRVAWNFNSEDGTLIVGGGDHKHTMLNYNSHRDTPWFSYRDSVKSIKIHDNIHTIGHHSFEGMSSVENILVPMRISKTSATAFVGTGYYTEMYNTLGVVYLYTGDYESGAIVYSHLIKVDPLKAGKLFIIQERTLSIAENAFEGCSGIRKLVVNKDIMANSIYSTAFSGLTGLGYLFFEGDKEVWDSFQNTLTKPGQTLEYTEVLFYSYYDRQSDDILYWHWNSDNTEPLEW
jgi:hypothetical protein